MKKENSPNSRTAFLRKISLGFVSVIGLSLAGINIQKLQISSEKKNKTISDKQANDIIKNMHSPHPKQLRPEPPPNLK